MKECDCAFPERRPKNGECGPELIERCHGDIHKRQCDCAFPERRPENGECGPELIERCHGGMEYKDE